MPSTFERFANRLSTDQQRILNLAVNYQLAKSEQAPGRYIRLSFVPDAEDHVRHNLQTLVPDYLGTWGQEPMDRYWITPAGLLVSEHGPRVSKLIEDVLQFFRVRISQNPMFSSFSWEDLKAVAMASGDQEFGLALLTLNTMKLTGGGSSTPGPPPKFTYELPFDIEGLRRMRTFDELLDVRTQALEEERRREALANAVFSPRYAELFVDQPAEPSPAIHVYGDVLMGGKYTTTVAGSALGAIAVGDRATATGSVTRHGALTQAQHEEYVRKAKKALVDDEGKLDELVHEALTQFLTLARKIQVEQQSLAETQAKMKATLDEVWAAQVAKGMKPEALPKTLEVVKALMENPLMGGVTKKLAGA